MSALAVCVGHDGWDLAYHSSSSRAVLLVGSSDGSSRSAPRSVCTTSPASLALPFLSGIFYVTPSCTLMDRITPLLPHTVGTMVYV